MQVVEQHPDMPGADVAAMYSALLAFSGAVYPDRLEYVDRVLQTCHNVSCQPAGCVSLLVLVLQAPAANQAVLLGRPALCSDILPRLPPAACHLPNPSAGAAAAGAHHGCQG